MIKFFLGNFICVESRVSCIGVIELWERGTGKVGLKFDVVLSWVFGEVYFGFEVLFFFVFEIMCSGFGYIKVFMCYCCVLLFLSYMFLKVWSGRRYWIFECV